ncbi:transglutaminase domain-containing protein [Ahniella affigens]|uniref:transglutaminase domain-containing protein n=1 Tax=Ahniella affigens TaxID=2021234 RepID=UPI0014738964|nr:transglutaminase domain-containing protein [Ahniella affigens]
MLAWFGVMGEAMADSISSETWYQVWLKGERIGYVRSVRNETDREIRHQETFSVSLKRATDPVRIWTEETHIESPQGKPLGFELNQRLGDSVAQARGQWQQDHWQVEQSDGLQWRQVATTIPADALLTEGSERLIRAARDAGEKEVRYAMFDPSSLSVVQVALTLGDLETVQSPTGPIKAYRVDQMMRMAGASLASTEWQDATGEMRYSRMPMLGTELELVLSTQAEATPEAIGGDLFHLTSLPAPRVLSVRERSAPMRYWLKVDGQVELPEQAGEQRARRVDAKHCELPDGASTRCFRIDIDAPNFRDQTIAAPELKTPSSWVQSDDPKIVAFATKKAQSAKTDSERMQLLTHAVSARLADKNLASAYASASEAFADRSGDCTEHALLLAAAGRALGIPTRIAAGLAYTNEFAGSSRVFVPHAWTQAFIDGRWQSFDAALGQYDSGHLLLAVGNGDPGMYFGSLNALGSLAIARIGKGRATP